MPQARVREGKRYRYFRETGTRKKQTRRGIVEEVIGDWVFAEGGEEIEVTSNALKSQPDFLQAVAAVEPIGEQDEPYADTEAVLDGQWQSVCKAISEIDDPELLTALREAEIEGRARGSVLDAIDGAMDECGYEPEDDAD